MIVSRILLASVPLLALAAMGQDQTASSASPAQAAQNAPADAAAAAPQQPAPPEVEQALRARVSQYYQDCVDRKYRDAENVLAEESKDWFYNHDKPQYKGFEIQSINWSDNFTHARVFVFLTVDMHLGTVTIPGHPTAEGEWKLVDGQWYLHLITPQEGFRTPFGTI